LRQKLTALSKEKGAGDIGMLNNIVLDFLARKSKVFTFSDTWNLK